MMKIKQNGYLIISVLASIISLIMIFLEPDIIPTHYGMAGIADGYASKWIMLILVALAIIPPMVFDYKFKRQKDEDKKSDIHFAYIYSIFTSCFVLFFNIKAFPNGNAFINIVKSIEVNRFLSVLFGIIFLLIAYALSKAPVNSWGAEEFVGKLKSEEKWTKAQKKIKTVFYILGLIMIVQAFVVPVIAILILIIVETLIMGIICGVVQYMT